MKQKFRDIIERISQTANISLFKDTITQYCNEKRVRLFQKIKDNGLICHRKNNSNKSTL